MTLAKQAICFACQRFRPGFPVATCAAFPDGIPDRILKGGFDHRDPFPGDGGVRFVRDPDQPIPPGFPEEREPADPVFLADPGEIRTQSPTQLRATAKRLIDQLRDHPERPR